MSIAWHEREAGRRNRPGEAKQRADGKSDCRDSAHPSNCGRTIH